MSKTAQRKTVRAKKQDADPSFEQSLESLEKIVHDLEQGELGLSASLERYEQGVQYLKQCYQQLEKAEQRIELLTRVDDDGQPITEPFDEQSMTLEEKAAARSNRRSRRPNASARSSVQADDNVDEPRGLF